MGLTNLLAGAAVEMQTQRTGVGWGRTWQGVSRGRGHMYTYGRFLWIYDRNQYDIVKQLSSN